MKTFAGLVVVVLAMATYWVLALRFGIYQRVPWLHLGIMLLGCGWLVYQLRDKRTVGRGIALVFSLGLTLLFAWYTLDYSNYDDRSHEVVTGKAVASLQGLVLPDHEGVATPVLTPGSRGTLVVFYRGFW